MAMVHILGVVNPNNDPIVITGVTQDEPTNGLGEGDTPIDAMISGDSVQLRAERSGNGNGLSIASALTLSIRRRPRMVASTCRCRRARRPMSQSTAAGVTTRPTKEEITDPFPPNG
jgi:hypothetical protein